MLYLFLQTAVKSFTGLLALFALVAAGALFLRKARVSALARLPRGVLAALLICAVEAAVIAQKDTRHVPLRMPSTDGVPMVVSDDGEGNSWGATNLRFTAIGVSSNSVWMSLAWPAGLLAGGDRLDIFSASRLPCPDDLLPTDDVSGVAWTLEGGGTTNNAPEGFVENLPGLGVLRCPLTSNGATLKVSCGDADYWPLVQFVEPSDIVTERVDYRPIHGRPMGAAGGVSLVTSLYVHPKDVNFEEIALEEIPWEQGGSVSGYYAQPSKLSDRFHDENHGAGKWRVVSNGNFWWKDVAGSKAITNWCEGVKVWDAPIGWNVKGSRDGDDYVKMIGSSSRFRQIFTIGADGTFRLDKFGHWVSRGVSTNPNGPDNGQYVLDGDLRNLNEDIERWRDEDSQGEYVEILP